MRIRWFLLAVLLLFIVYTGVGESALTGFAVGNASVDVHNDPPNFTTISNQTLSFNTNFTINLSQYFIDPELVPLNFTVSVSNNATAVVNPFDPIVIIVPDFNFTGNVTVIFTGFDFVNFVDSNSVNIEFNGTVAAPSPTPTPTPSAGAGAAAAEVVPTVEGKAGVRVRAPGACPDRRFFVEDRFVDEQRGTVVFTSLNACDLLLFGESSDDRALLATMLVKDKPFVQDGVDVIFLRVNGDMVETTLQKGIVYAFDTDGDGLGNYELLVTAIDGGLFDLQIHKVPLTTLLFLRAEGYLRVQGYFVLLILAVILVMAGIIMYILRRK